MFQRKTSEHLINCELFGIAEELLAHSVDILGNLVIYAREGGHGQTLGTAGDVELGAVSTAGFFNLLSDNLIGGLREVYGSTVDTAHNGQLSAVFFDDVGQLCIASVVGFPRSCREQGFPHRNRSDER